MTLALDDPVPLHVLLMSSYDALREYANAKAIFIEIEWTDYIKDEFQREWINEYFKNKFYFLKHGTPDTNFVDFKNVAFLNDMQLLHNITMFRTIFHHSSAHMHHFSFALAGIYPHLFRWDKMKVPTNFADELFRISGELNRTEMLTAYRQDFYDNPDVRNELERDRALATVEDPSRRERLRTPEPSHEK